MNAQHEEENIRVVHPEHEVYGKGGFDMERLVSVNPSRRLS
jgi:hypothetical protein